MTVSYSLAPVPKWYIADLVGLPLAGGYLATFSSLDHTALNPVYEDSAGAFIWPYVTIPHVGSLGILFDENGAQGPFYFRFDTATPNLLYYLEVYDSAGVLQWTIDDFSPVSGSGGSIVTTALDIDNLVTNNVMWRNSGTSVSPLPVSLKIAPGAHAALANNILNSSGTYSGPDIYFIKNNTNATDAITFPTFALGSTQLTGDVTPVDYLKYVCTNAPAGETVKCVQFPITHSVQNLTNQDVTVTIWARANSGTSNITLNWYQFFGDGAGATSPVTTPIQTLTLTTSWQKFTTLDTVPDVTGLVLGACRNDGLFLQVQYPLGATCDIDFTKPCVFLGSIAPAEEYVTYDMIDGVINAQRTGYVMSGFDTASPGGYVMMNDGTVGSATSGGTTRANADTFPLFNLLWNNVSDTYAPVSTGRGASAVADFTANKTINLTRMLGRVLGGSGAGAGLTARILGQYLGAETISIASMPAHTHDSDGHGSFLTTNPNDTALYGGGGLGHGLNATGSTGGSAVDGNMPPVSFMNFFIKL